MENIKNATIVGGNWGNEIEDIKRSSIIDKLYASLFDHRYAENVIEYNGGLLKNLPLEHPISDLILWMPNIDNENTKHYPSKPVGSVLICSKVMHDGYTTKDSVSRIFKMHGNAVIEIYKDSNPFRFVLKDALANVWIDTSDIEMLVTSIVDFYKFTKNAKRIQTFKKTDILPEDLKDTYISNKDNLSKLLDINKSLQEHIMTACGNRFFGNISTRCQKLFPTTRISSEYMYVSPRNSDKSSLEANDMILYSCIDNGYYNENKPSVDSPCQSLLYQHYKNINYMIHGHATIYLNDNSELYTENYKLCGDVNEVNEIKNILLEDSKYAIINLKNHGFLLMSDTLDNLKNIVNKIITNSQIIIK